MVAVRLLNPIAGTFSIGQHIEIEWEFFDDALFSNAKGDIELLKGSKSYGHNEVFSYKKLGDIALNVQLRYGKSEWIVGDYIDSDGNKMKADLGSYYKVRINWKLEGSDIINSTKSDDNLSFIHLTVSDPECEIGCPSEIFKGQLYDAEWTCKCQGPAELSFELTRNWELPLVDGHVWLSPPVNISNNEFNEGIIKFEIPRDLQLPYDGIYRIRVNATISLPEPGNEIYGRAVDYAYIDSRNGFSIGYLNITSPKDIQHWRIGDEKLIRWNALHESIDRIDVKLLKNIDEIGYILSNHFTDLRDRDEASKGQDYYYDEFKWIVGDFESYISESELKPGIYKIVVQGKQPSDYSRPQKLSESEDIIIYPPYKDIETTCHKADIVNTTNWLRLGYGSLEHDHPNRWGIIEFNMDQISELDPVFLNGIRVCKAKLSFSRRNNWFLAPEKVIFTRLDHFPTATLPNPNRNFPLPIAMGVLDENFGPHENPKVHYFEWLGRFPDSRDYQDIVEIDIKPLSDFINDLIEDTATSSSNTMVLMAHADLEDDYIFENVASFWAQTFRITGARIYLSWRPDSCKEERSDDGLGKKEGSLGPNPT